MAYFENVDVFDPNSETWILLWGKWCEWGQDKKDNITSACGSRKYGLVMDLIAPQKPTQVSYADLIQRVGEHFDPKPNVIAEQFTNQCQKPSSSSCGKTKATRITLWVWRDTRPSQRSASMGHKMWADTMSPTSYCRVIENSPRKGNCTRGSRPENTDPTKC
jgi:hypothetical protein